MEIWIRACGSLGIGFRMRWVAELQDFHKTLENWKALISWRKRFSQKRVFYGIKTTNRPAQNDRKDREKISCFHEKVRFMMVFTGQTRVFHENLDFHFSV